MRERFATVDDLSLEDRVQNAIPTNRMLLLWVVISGLSQMLYGQISPGPLTHAHQSLDSAAKCTSCHNFGLGERGFKCMECHVEIAHRVEQKRGYHGIAYRASASQQDCVRCHQEHNGRQFQITKFDRAKFDHKSLAKFALEGKHAQLTCEKCHAATRIAAEAKAEIKVRDLNHTYMGLGRDCTSCHKDIHAGQLGASCTNCHSQDAWKPAEGFNHNRTKFQLTGLHQNVMCEKCHSAPPADSGAKYKNLAFQTCDNCHRDPHRGAFRGTASAPRGCDGCHSTLGWKSILPSNTFDHGKTKFPLHGKHVDTTCFKCHKNSDFSTPVAHAVCKDCHEDIHKGQFDGRKAGADCAACHSETVFKPALFTRETHQTSAFKLEGSHVKLDCVKCHFPAGKDASYMTKKAICVDCHEDAHGSEFRAAPWNNKCDSCHTQEHFQPSSFTFKRHAETKFLLSGAHAAVICSDCHKPLAIAATAATPAAKNAARQYHFAAQNCQSCHKDPHQLPTTASNISKQDFTCDTCHNTRQWKEVRVFDHKVTKFELDGAHQSATCISCHRPAETAAANANRPTANFARTPKLCSECHEDVHGGQFLSQGKATECSSCHSISKWSAGTFDHNKTTFSLEGAHAKVRCAQCHQGEMEVNGRTSRVYRGTPTKCVDCHGPSGKPDGKSGGQ